MSLVKICPSCGHLNDINNSMCDNCLADISAVSPQDTKAVHKNNTGNRHNNHHEDTLATVIERRRTLRFEATDGSGSFEVDNDSVVGREAKGNECLKNQMTVSRQHARIFFNGSWFIEDMSSTNGTYVNEIRVNQGKPHTIKNNDIVALSKSCRFTVKE